MNKHDLDKTIAKEKNPIILDFWASWCVPCRVTKPVLEKVAAEYMGRVKFIPVNADESKDLLEKFQVHGIPTVIAIKKGAEVGRVTGGRNEQAYRAFFESTASGLDFKPGISIFDRLFRLGSGAALLIYGASAGNAWAVAAGGIVAFLGFYDRCPVWKALTKRGQHRS